MLKQLKSLFFIIPICFLLGLSWGVKLVRDAHKTDDSDFDGSVSLLLQSDFLPEKIVQQFQNEFNIKLKIKTVDSPFHLIKETLKSDSDYDLIESVSYNYHLIQNTKYSLPLPVDTNFVSADFRLQKHSQFSNSVFPVYWDMHIFTKNKDFEILDQSFRETLLNSKYKNKISLSPEPEEIYFVSKRNKIIVDQWIKTSQSEKLQTSLAGLFENVNVGTLSNPKNEIILKQTKLSEINKTKDNSQVEYFPESKSTLFLRGLSINKEKSQKLKNISTLLTFLSSKRIARQLSETNSIPSVNNKINSLDIKKTLKPHYLRSLPIGRIDIPLEHFGYESLWIETLKHLPDDKLKNLDFVTAVKVD